MIHVQRREPARWPTPSEQQRELRARCAHVDWLKQEYQRDQGRTEALLARHWPELTRELDLDSATLPKLLAQFGSAQAVAAQPESARQLLRKVSRDLLAKDKIGRVVDGAQHSLGLPPTASEQRLLQELGRRMLESRRQLSEAERAALQVAREVPAMKPLSDFIGPMTTAIFLAFIGDPGQFSSARTLLKMLGLNLRERSSGKFKGQLKISKRGNSVVRRWLYLAALRLMKEDRVVRAWVDHKAQRSGGMKMKAIIALMRKIVSSLRHVTDGNPFDSTKLFDVKRLKRMRALPANFHAAPAV
jgi:transposase